jgi:hypothetical protein
MTAAILATVSMMPAAIDTASSVAECEGQIAALQIHA